MLRGRRQVYGAAAGIVALRVHPRVVVCSDSRKVMGREGREIGDRNFVHWGSQSTCAQERCSASSVRTNSTGWCEQCMHCASEHCRPHDLFWIKSDQMQLVKPQERN